MAHGHTKLDEADKEPIGAKLWPLFRLLGAAAIIGLVLLVVGVVIEASREGGDWQGRFFYAYLIGYAFVLSLTVGSVALVILTHLFRAGWVVAIRRVPETFAANFWFVGVLAIPILVGAMMPEAPLYSWSASLEVAEARYEKAEAFIKELHHAHGSHEEHDEDHAEDHALSDTPDVLYVASETADEHDGKAKKEIPLAVPNETYREAALAMASAGDAYPENKEHAAIIQDAYYQSLLAYMLDYKRYGGQLGGDAQVPEGKGYTWYNPLLFALRLVLYFVVLSVIGWYYWTRSIKQDETGDADLTTKREWWAPASTGAFALMITFLSFDLIMSLDPAWYSTMFGVIFFANSFTAAIATTILVCMFLQKKGYLKTVNTEHYHDLGKLLFAFVFFWGYVSFSQFMLIWYASFPETTYWFEIHGMTTVSTAPQYGSGWTWISLGMLFGHLFIPFAFLLSRHVKRNLTALACASVWMLLMVYLDFYWYVMPFFASPEVTFGLPEIGAVFMLLAVVLAAFVRRYARYAPLAYGDPRLHESTALDTNVWAPLHH
ncbi:MAG: hypothetical protein AB8C95_06645 [Phycisphaeraceae bacterium]